MLKQKGVVFLGAFAIVWAVAFVGLGVGVVVDHVNDDKPKTEVVEK